MATTPYNPPALVFAAAFAGAIAFVAVVAIGLSQYAGFALSDELSKKVLTQPTRELDALRAEEQARLTNYQWVDQKAGIVRIPVDRALELTLRDWSHR